MYISYLFACERAACAYLRGFPGRYSYHEIPTHSSRRRMAFLHTPSTLVLTYLTVGRRTSMAFTPFLGATKQRTNLFIFFITITFDVGANEGKKKA